MIDVGHEFNNKSETDSLVAEILCKMQKPTGRTFWLIEKKTISFNKWYAVVLHALEHFPNRNVSYLQTFTCGQESSSPAILP